MIGKSLANCFLYTKLKYKQYLYFSLNIPLMFFFFIQFICLVSPWFFFVYLKFYLMYYQDNNTEHQKVIYPPYSRNCQSSLEKKGNKQKYSSFLQLKCCAQCSLLVDITHYWLFKFLVGRQISSWSLVNVNCKYRKKSILYC